MNAIRLVASRATEQQGTALASATTFSPAFHPGAANRCPYCAGTAFHVGRITAECGHCGTPLPIAPTRRPIVQPQQRN